MNLTEFVAAFAVPFDLTSASASVVFGDFPVELGIPTGLAEVFHDAYCNGERCGQEIGWNLLFDGRGNWDVTDMSFGTSDGVQINAMTDDHRNVADFHSHPSASIGHVDGYSAHSVADFLVFEHHLSKPIFIRFVSSGGWLYAAVYKKGTSKFVKNELRTYIAASDEEGMKYFETKCLVDLDSRNMAMSVMNSSQEQGAYMQQRRTETPGLGKAMEHISIRYCLEVAEKHGFGFYAGRIDQGQSVIRRVRKKKSRCVLL